MPFVVFGPNGGPMKVAVVASGDLDPADATALDGADRVIAADGGAASLERFGRRPDLLIGDLDSTEPSLVERLIEAGVTVERHPADKEASDTELALLAATQLGADEIVVLGAIGGARLDHELANLLLLADPALRGRAVRVVHAGNTVRVVHPDQPLALDGRIGDLVTLLPIGGEATGVTTAGLRWPLDAATLQMGRSRGLSNEIVMTPASVRLESGLLLVAERTREEE
ncbi:MAG TPA: thiamine diphosphokinase [Candidatus Limnocylindria bacterium]|nr:thiamine diphosphokinase [Candidatus Limnocylindria bacterium]